ncbi:hypothetical protein QYE80_08225 [Pseudomonas tohonis]|nr:hypothetical protein L682_27185 [Pseudomonas alcaligenes OT 69]MDN4144961.1 hypothetical protein [Pseudomonas tohonis]
MNTSAAFDNLRRTLRLIRTADSIDLAYFHTNIARGAASMAMELEVIRRPEGQRYLDLAVNAREYRLDELAAEQRAKRKALA